MARVKYPGYPPQVLKPETPYIYFDSLLKTEDGGREIYNQVKPYFEKNITGITGDTAEIDAALNFLQQIINTEAAKEAAFINYFSTKFKDLKELKVPSLTSDWTEFVQTIQTAISFGQANLVNLRNEKSRLQTNAALATKNESKSYEYMKTAADYTSKEMESLYKFMKNGSQNTNGEKILDLILNKFGNKLFELDTSGNLIFNKSTLFSLITMIQSLVMKQYTSITFDTPTKGLDLSKVEKILESDNFTAEINDFLDRVHTLPFLGEDIARSLGFGKFDEKFSQEEAQKLNTLARQQKSIEKRKKELTKTLQSYYSKGFITDSAFKLISEGNAYAEIESMFNFSMSKMSIYSSNTGSAGAKPDNLLALLSIDLTSLDLSNKEIVDELTAIHSEMLELESGLAKTNDQQYYEAREKAWNTAQQRIDEHLKKLSKYYDDLIQCFIIEDSTKNYTSLYSTSHYGRTNSEFHGGSLGPNITDQINKLDAIYQAGGLTPLDTKWLIAAAINMGSGMIARAYKSSLEQYLATFACILLFDDQINIAKEAYTEVAKNAAKANSNVQKIHLFSLNGGYYPISFILQITHDNLRKAYKNAQSLVVDGSGAKVHITGFVSEPTPPYKETKREKLWSATAKTALGTTKIKLSFLTNFMNVLNTLYPT